MSGFAQKYGVDHAWVGYSKKYKYVVVWRNRKSGEMLYMPHSSLGGGGKVFRSERAAAIHVDIMLIRKGKKPVNILTLQGTRKKG